MLFRSPGFESCTICTEVICRRSGKPPDTTLVTRSTPCRPCTSMQGHGRWRTFGSRAFRPPTCVWCPRPPAADASAPPPGSTRFPWLTIKGGGLTYKFMGTLGVGELAFIFILALLLFGPKKLPELGKGLAEGIRSFKDGIKG